MIEQMSIFDVLSRQEHEEHLNMIEPPVGTYVETCGAVICSIICVNRSSVLYALLV